MFGAILRAAAAFVAGILLWTPLDVIVGSALNLVLRPNLPQDSVIIWALESGVTNWPLVLMFAIVTGLVARATTESRLGGAPR